MEAVIRDVLNGDIWSKRDRRVDGYFLLSSPIPTALICLTYVFAVKVVGPKFMENRKPYDLKNFLVIYNAFQVVFSTFIFSEVINNIN